MPAGTEDEAGVEINIVVAGVKVGREGEDAINARIIELVARTIHDQLLPANKPFWVGQDDGSDRKTSETKLVSHEDHTRTTNRPTAVLQAKLGGDDQNVARLLLGDKIQRVPTGMGLLSGIDSQVLGEVSSVKLAVGDGPIIDA